MVKLLHSSCGLAAAVLLVVLLNPAVAWNFSFTKKHVRVTNNITPSATLNVHCKSGDDDLGDHSLDPTQEYSWSFRDNIFGTTLFWCYMNWENSYGERLGKSFDVYEAVVTPCNKDCIWSIKTDGVYLFNDTAQAFVKEYFWEKEN